MLEVEALTAGYGSIEVLHRISLRVARGQSVCLIGANGAGKTTLLRCLGGLLPPSEGRICIEGTDICRPLRVRPGSISASLWCRKAAASLRR